MNISATNCTPIKPQASFKGDNNFSDKEFDKLMEVSDKFNDEYVHSDNIKKPLAIIGSVALATLTAFVFGSKIVGFARRAYPKLTNPDDAKYFENYIKKGAEKVKKFATDLQSNEGGKFSKVKNMIGKGIEKAEDLTKTAYKKITNIGTKNLQNPGDIAAKKLENLGGAAAVATMVPGALNSDSDGDGVSDLCQRGVNAYTGTKTQINNTIEKANVLGDLIDALT